MASRRDIEELIAMYAGDRDIPPDKLERALYAATDAAESAVQHGATLPEASAEAFVQGLRAMRGTHRVRTFP
jgi:hypothetical protein